MRHEAGRTAAAETHKTAYESAVCRAKPNSHVQGNKLSQAALEMQGTRLIQAHIQSQRQISRSSRISHHCCLWSCSSGRTSEKVRKSEMSTTGG